MTVAATVLNLMATVCSEVAGIYPGIESNGDGRRSRLQIVLHV